MLGAISVGCAFLHAPEDKLVSVVAISQRAVDAADSGSGSPRFFCDFQISLLLPEHGRHFKALGQGKQLVHGT